MKEQTNHDKKMEEIIKDLEYTPKLLLHSCCAPCSSAVIERLTQSFDITIFYYNPNIEPEEEYRKRKEEEIRFIKEYPSIHKLEIIDCDYDNEVFHEIAKGLEDCAERGPRCIKCYYLRLEKTAQVAKEKRYDFFTTTLTVSPYKDSQVINEIGKQLEEKYKVKYLYSDFKKKNGYKRSIELSKEYQLYRQDYCGCIYSQKQKNAD